jgi:hypothetical protein
MHQFHWYSATLRITVLDAQAHTIADEQRRDRTTKRGRPLGRVGLALLALALPLLATDRGLALLAGVPRYVRPAVRPRALVRSKCGGPALPAGPA